MAVGQWSVVHSPLGRWLERLHWRTTDDSERSERATDDGLVPQRLVGREDALDARLGLLLAQQREEHLALEFEQVVLVHLGGAGEVAARHHPRQPAGQVAVVGRDVVAGLELVERYLKLGPARRAEDRDRRAHRRR